MNYWRNLSLVFMGIFTAIIATRGPEYKTGKGFGSAESDYNQPPIKSTQFSIKTPNSIFLDGLVLTVNRLQHSGINSIAYVMQIPELGVSARNCLQRPFSFEDHSGCRVPFPVYAERMRQYRDGIKELTKIKGFSIVDLEPFFCNEYFCSGFRNESLLYTDDNHLSVSGSFLVAPIIYKALRLEKIL